ncbi:hypothetical protein IFM89_005132 [Coptis chinensis]|uniref:Uncharacterized protein n=1 Tax=Coptis chinensis TaxID=261450 RepID=A0A835M4A7_9MAGN|nr:hypothetical protein IFM89_005132 [Coptis chinensis]
MCLGSYDSGQTTPWRCSSHPGGFFNCTAGNSSVELYIAMHHVLLAHASIVFMHWEKYQGSQSSGVWRLFQNHEEECWVKNSIIYERPKLPRLSETVVKIVRGFLIPIAI